jgi:hypothetical protein
MTKENKDRFKKLSESFNGAIEGFKNEIFSAPNGEMTILFQKLNKYSAEDITDDKAEYDAANGEKVLVNVDSNGNVSLNKNGQYYKDQHKEASDWIESQVRIQIDKAIKSEQPLGQLSYPPTPSTSGEKESGTVLDSWMTFFSSPTAAGKGAAKTGILNSEGAQKLGLVDIDLTPDGKSYVMKYKDGRIDTKPLPTNAREWATAGSGIVGTFKEKDINPYLNKGYGQLAAGESIGGGKYKYGVPSLLVGKDYGVAPELQKNIDKFHKGFVVNPTGVLNQYIQIIAPDGTPSPEYRVNQDMTNNTIVMDKITAFIEEHSGGAAAGGAAAGGAAAGDAVFGQ